MEERTGIVDGIGWIRPPDGHLGGARACLSLRGGGVSPPPFESLNLGHSSGDDPGRVQANEDRLARALVLPAPPARARLAHGTDCRVVDSPGIYASYDGLLTSSRGLPLWITVADCLPIFLSLGDWIGLLHCGWKGAAAGCVAAMVARIGQEAGGSPAAMRAWIGPGIGSSCYPVGPDVARRFPRGAVSVAAGVTRLDLPRAAEIFLLEAGLDPASICRSSLCTACRPDLFFSYRRDGARSGRMAAVIWR